MTKFPIRKVNEIRSTFPLTLTLTLTDGRIPPIVGDPTAKELLRVQAVIKACAKSQHSEFSNLGHSFMAKPPTVMATYGEAPFVRPTKPSVGPQPDFIGNFLQAQMETTHDTWTRNDADRQNIDNVDKALFL